jgi:hypothetical protein
MAILEISVGKRLDSLAKSYRTFEKADFKNLTKPRKTIV